MKYVNRIGSVGALALVLAACGGGGGGSTSSTSSGDTDNSNTGSSLISTSAANFTPETLYTGESADAELSSSNQDAITQTAFAMLGNYLDANGTETSPSAVGAGTSPARQLAGQSGYDPMSSTVVQGSCGGTYTYGYETNGAYPAAVEAVYTFAWVDYCTTAGTSVNGDSYRVMNVDTDNTTTNNIYMNQTTVGLSSTVIRKHYQTDVMRSGEVFYRYKSWDIEYTTTSSTLSSYSHRVGSRTCSDALTCDYTYISPLSSGFVKIVNPTVTSSSSGYGFSGDYYDPTYGKLHISASAISLCSDGSIESGTMTITDPSRKTIEVEFSSCSATQATVSYQGGTLELVTIRP